MAEFEPYLRGSTAEIGAGIGTYSEQILKHVESLDLIEPAPGLCDRIRSSFSANPRVRVFGATAEGWSEAASPGSYDTIVMINVLEHIRDDGRLLTGLSKLLRPGGRLLLFVPALDYLYSRIDKLLGHHRRYALPELRDKVEAAGFAVRSARYFDCLGTIPWFVVNKLGQATKFSPWAARLYDTFGVPVTRALERWISPPLGKNIILVAQRAS